MAADHLLHIGSRYFRPRPGDVMCRTVVILGRTDLDYMGTPNDVERVLGIRIPDEDGPTWREEMGDWRETCFCCSDPVPAMEAAGYVHAPDDEAAIFDIPFHDRSEAPAPDDDRSAR